jgi:ribose 5-phosphate isomerase A
MGHDLQADIKRTVGRRVSEMVENGMVLGIGTGSTAACAIEEIGRRIRNGSLEVRGVPSSFAAERLARRWRIPLTTLDDAPDLDLAFDGADEVDPDLNLIKGRGAAHSREKVIAAAARRFVVLVDASKQVDVLGTRVPVPVEVLPMAATPVTNKLEEMGATVVLRQGINKDGPIVTDQGLWVLDARFEAITDPAKMDRLLNDIPGVLDHGLFVAMATDVLVGLSPERVSHLTP